MTHICVSNLTIIGSDNGLSPDRRQAIICTNDGILLIGHLGTNFSENLIGIRTFSFYKMLLKMSSAKWRPFCLGLNVLCHCNIIPYVYVDVITYPWSKAAPVVAHFGILQDKQQQCSVQLLTYITWTSHERNYTDRKTSTLLTNNPSFHSLLSQNKYMYFVLWNRSSNFVWHLHSSKIIKFGSLLTRFNYLIKYKNSPCESDGSKFFHQCYTTGIQPRDPFPWMVKN